MLASSFHISSSFSVIGPGLPSPIFCPSHSTTGATLIELPMSSISAAPRAFLHWNIGEADSVEHALLHERLGEIENSLDRDARQDRVEGRMAEHAILGHERYVHVGAFRDHAALVDENAVVGAAVFGFQDDEHIR